MELKATYSYVSLNLEDKATHAKTSYVQSYEESSPHNEVTAQALFNLPKGFEFDPTYRYLGALPVQLIKSYATVDVRLGWHSPRTSSFPWPAKTCFNPIMLSSVRP